MRKRVLIVDDDPAVLRLMADILSEQGWDTSAAGSLQEAQKIAGPWDLVVADVRLPNGDGRHLRETLPDVPFLVVSGFPEDHDREPYFLEKPFGAQQLRKKVGECLGVSP